MQRGQAITVDNVDEAGTTLGLSITNGQKRYHGLLTRHTCTEPRRLDAGDVVVVRSSAPSKHVLVQIPCGCELMLFVA
jgi:hypothetical protein